MSTETTPSEAEILNTWWSYRMAEVRGTSPGQVVDYDPATQTATVQPLLRDAFQAADGTLEFQDAPALRGVPVEFPAGGGWRIAWALLPGDVVTLEYAARSLEEWKANGRAASPRASRMFDYRDAIARPALRSPANPQTALPATNLVVGREDGSVQLELSPEGAVLTAPEVALGGLGGPAVARVGDAIEVNDPVFLAWLRGLAAAVAASPLAYAIPLPATISGVIVSGSPGVTST